MAGCTPSLCSRTFTVGQYRYCPCNDCWSVEKNSLHDPQFADKEHSIASG
ncbi:hypothetical protein ALC60_02651 [Trachymyrmex zeteki]|uniref:Uncharacterized protein n=1 Tax=Mycetomoellerius zeteki TaxID=64791 RepID=A0A151XCX8_9HYME|nr:hypothetical protein ALC60_02651 [Trachymyrmex zeteki]